MEDNYDINVRHVEDNRINSLDWNHISVELRNVDFGYSGDKREMALKDVTMTVPKSAM